jgi:hypothetical protein
VGGFAVSNAIIPALIKTHAFKGLEISKGRTGGGWWMADGWCMNVVSTDAHIDDHLLRTYTQSYTRISDVYENLKTSQTSKNVIF